MTTRFRLNAKPEAQCLSRVLDHFAQRGLIPSRIVTNHVGPVLEIMIEHPTIEEPAAALLGERMRQIVFVESVSMSRSGKLFV